MSSKRAAIYTRVSSDEQAREGLSLGLQEDRCRCYALAQGWEVVDVFTDAGVSGAKASRPALDAMLAAVERREVDVIVVAKLDRLGRSMRHLSPMLGALDDRGVALVSIAEAFDSASTTGRLLRNMLGSMAEWERDVIRERTRSGVNARVRNGGWGGGHLAPFGYRVVGVDAEAHLEVDQREAEVVRTAVSLVLDHGLSTLQVAQRLNALGMTPRSAPLWTSQNVRNCLRRGQWDGRWTFGKNSTKGTVPEPIVVAVAPILEADRAAALTAHLSRTTLVKGRAGVHPLTGRLICSCGQPMTGIARSDRAIRRYRCRHGRNTPGKPFCDQPSLRGDAVDQAIWAQVLTLLNDPEHLLALAAERLSLLHGAVTVEADALAEAERAVERTQKALSGAVARCISLGLDEPTTEATLTELRAQHRSAVQHRAMVASLMADTAEAQRRMTSAQQLADIASERLMNADKALQAKVFALLDLRVCVDRSDGTLRLHMEGSVAHDLLLSSVREETPAPPVPATACA